MADRTDNTSEQLSDAPVERTTLLMAGVFVVILIIGVFLIGKFFFFNQNDAGRNANIAEENVGP
jgi:hypothetical protein